MHCTPFFRSLCLAVEHCWVFGIGSCEPVHEDRTDNWVETEIFWWPFLVHWLQHLKNNRCKAIMYIICDRFLAVISRANRVYCEYTPSWKISFGLLTSLFSARHFPTFSPLNISFKIPSTNELTCFSGKWQLGARKKIVSYLKNIDWSKINIKANWAL